ncbi:partner of bursicon-like [Amphiura filiformis]|uniref:partner of bursicon-like n=1 Tax=Amphiura filiformis TaxID=82378 RepID=UPI003B221CD6
MNTAACLLQSCSSLLLLGLIAYLVPVLHASRNNRCTLSTSAVSIQDQVVDGDTQTTASCRGTVELNMCEGRCRSWEFPSATTSDGFDRHIFGKNSWSPRKSRKTIERIGKVCKCCQERNMQTRTVWLTECRDQRSDVLIPNFIHPVDISEPSACRCEHCTI